MGNLGEEYREAGNRLSNTGAFWEALCLIASYCTANFPLLPVSNGAMHLFGQIIVSDEILHINCHFFSLKKLLNF